MNDPMTYNDAFLTEIRSRYPDGGLHLVKDAAIMSEPYVCAGCNIDVWWYAPPAKLVGGPVLYLIQDMKAHGRPGIFEEHTLSRCHDELAALEARKAYEHWVEGHGPAR